MTSRSRAHSPVYNSPLPSSVSNCVHLWIVALVALVVLALATTACGGGSATSDAASARISDAGAEALLAQTVLQPADLGAGFTQESARAGTNEDAAKARPDTDKARQQYADWGQVLQYNVQYAAAASTGLVFNAKIARVMNTATYYETPDGPRAALAYTRDLPPNTVANFLISESAGTKITDTQVVKDIAFPSKGDDSFAWRLTGKAVFENGFTVAFVADSIFVRVGRITGNVTAVALGQAPDRAAVTALVDAYIAHARAAE